MNNYNMTTLRLRQQKINEGKIDIDTTKEKICRNCFWSKRLIVGCCGDAGMICELKTEYRGDEPIYQAVEENDTCDNFQY